MLWVAALLTLVTGWDYLRASLRHAQVLAHRPRRAGGERVVTGPVTPLRSPHRAVLGIAGWSGAGKTTLIEAVMPRLRAAGLSVSTVKHAHHGAELDRPGKDSWRHRAAGAHEVLVAGAGPMGVAARGGGAGSRTCRACSRA